MIQKYSVTIIIFVISVQFIELINLNIIPNNEPEKENERQYTHPFEHFEKSFNFFVYFFENLTNHLFRRLCRISEKFIIMLYIDRNEKHIFYFRFEVSQF